MFYEKIKSVHTKQSIIEIGLRLKNDLSILLLYKFNDSSDMNVVKGVNIEQLQ